MIKVVVRDVSKKPSESVKLETQKVHFSGRSDVYDKNSINSDLAKYIQKCLDIGVTPRDGTYINFDQPSYKPVLFSNTQLVGTQEDRRNANGIYRRTISKTMAKALRFAYDHVFSLGNENCFIPSEVFYNEEDCKKMCADFAKFRHWGIIARCKRVDDFSDRRYTIGAWRFTDTGKDFAEGLISVNKFVYLSDGTLVDYADCGDEKLRVNIFDIF